MDRLIQFLLFVIALLQSISGVTSTELRVINKCNYTVWPGIISNPGISTAGFVLKTGESRIISVPSSWLGMLWARTQCTQDSTGGNFYCEIGDCATGRLECQDIGVRLPATVITFGLGQPEKTWIELRVGQFKETDFYFVSVANGFNVPVAVVPHGGCGSCKSTYCLADMTTVCPQELRVRSKDGKVVVACKGPCDIGESLDSCLDSHEPSHYSHLFKSVCQRAYSYTYDDQTSLFTCKGADYTITFCESPYTTNLEASGSPPCRAFVIIITAVMGTIITSVTCGYFLWKWKTKHLAGKWNIKQLLLKRHSANGDKTSGDIIGKLSQVKFKELLVYDFEKVAMATNNFQLTNKLGQGGFGPVYKGTLKDGQDIAVKRLSRASGQGQEEFMNEMVIISRLQHRNLVKLLGCCIEGEEKILIYEYMPNKSLDAFIFDLPKCKLLDWGKRFVIIEGIARGVLYLHRDSRLKIIHRDLKAGNILLDENLIPKISDFGMARIFKESEDHANTKRVVGTYGYMSPEYAMEGLFSEKSDVFSFGVILLEIISGRRSSSFYNNENSLSLLGFAWKLWNEHNIIQLIDLEMLNQNLEKDIVRCIHIGLLCVQDLAIERPSMSTVVSMLNSEIVYLPPPRQPAFIQWQSILNQLTPEENQRLFSNNRVSISEIQGR